MEGNSIFISWTAFSKSRKAPEQQANQITVFIAVTAFIGILWFKSLVLISCFGLYGLLGKSVGLFIHDYGHAVPEVSGTIVGVFHPTR